MYISMYVKTQTLLYYRMIKCRHAAARLLPGENDCQMITVKANKKINL